MRGGRATTMRDFGTADAGGAADAAAAIGTMTSLELESDVALAFAAVCWTTTELLDSEGGGAAKGGFGEGAL